MYLAGGLALSLVLAYGGSREWAVERELVWVRGSAWCALVALSLSLCATPLGRLLARVGRPIGGGIARFRRATGITAAALASAHAALGLCTYLRESWHHLLEVPWLRSGVVAGTILLALWITSYPTVLRRGRVSLFKPLHRLAYVAFGLVLHHAFLSPMAPRQGLLWVAATVALFGLLRLLPARSPRTE